MIGGYHYFRKHPCMNVVFLTYLRGGWTKAWLASLFARVCQRAGGGGGGGGHKSSGVNTCEKNVKAALTNVRFNWTWKVRNWNPWPRAAKNWFSIHFPHHHPYTTAKADTTPAAAAAFVTCHVMLLDIEVHSIRSTFFFCIEEPPQQTIGRCFILEVQLA